MTLDRLRDRGCGLIFVVTGPSGTGKSTLVARLVDRLGGLRFGVSHTTRPRRTGEEDGVDYHFVEPATFHGLVERGAMLEWAEVHGKLYGTSLQELERILADGRDALLDLDVQGAESVRRQRPEAVRTFLLPPDRDEMERRLVGRGAPDEEIRRRLANARREVRAAEGYDYLVVNDHLEDAAALLEAIVLAERSRRERRRREWERIAATFSAAG